MSTPSRIRVLVPFSTFRRLPATEENMTSDEDYEGADVEVVAVFQTNSVEETHELIKAAEVFGFHCSYDSGPPDEDSEEFATVTITARAVIEAE